MNIADRTVNALQQRTAYFTQTENAALDYTVNWAATISPDTIATSTWSSEDSGINISSATNTTTSARAIIYGTPGRYDVVNKITTAGGITDERIINVHVRDNDYTVNEGDYE